MDGVGSVLTWWRTCVGVVLAWVVRLRGKRPSIVGVGSVGGRLACVAWVGWVVCLC